MQLPSAHFKSARAQVAIINLSLDPVRYLRSLSKTGEFHDETAHKSFP